MTGEPRTEQSTFYSPTPSGTPLSGRDIDRRAVQWMVDFGMCQGGSPITKIDVGTFVSLCYPYCVREEHLDIAARLNYLGFAFDDEHVTDPSLRTCAGLTPAIGQLLAVLDAPEALTDDPYQRALGDTMGRLARHDQRSKHAPSDRRTAQSTALHPVGHERLGTRRNPEPQQLRHHAHQ